MLENLGLSLTQAKTYLALIHLGRAKVGEIHKYSGVSRQDIYRVLEKLHDFGLIEKIVCSPVEFVPIPLSDGLSLLIERKRMDFEKITKKAEEMKCRSYFSNISEQEVSSHHITATVERDALNSKTRRLFETAHQSIEYVCNWKAFITGTLELLNESKRAARRGVKGRTVVELPKYSLSVPKSIQKLIYEKSLELRTMEAIPFFFLGIIDKKEIIFTPSPQNNTQAITYWSRNRGFVELANDYFENLWDKAGLFNIQALQNGTTKSQT